MVNQDAVSLFMKVHTEETLKVVRDKLAADLLLDELTCILIDKLMILWGSKIFRNRVCYTSTRRRSGYTIAIVDSTSIADNGF